MNKTKILLKWNGKETERYILNKSLVSDTEEEEYYFVSQFDGIHNKSEVQK